jgi:cytidine deaminase
MRERETETSECIQIRTGEVDVTSGIDWKMLQHKATEAAGHAYAPYSGFAVGAAALVDDHRMIAGCNVENVSYGLALCAECAVVCALYSSGGGRLIALSCVDATGEVLMPCGRCRQVLMEHGGPQMLIDHPLGPRPLSELLPDAFGPQDLGYSQRPHEEELP